MLTHWTENADPEVQIDWFDDFDGPNKFGFLSNFYVGEPIEVPRTVMGGPHVLLWEGEYKTGEHAFQAMKAPSSEGWGWVNSAESPGEAKARGRSVNFRYSWEQIKYDVMREVLAHKFAPGRAECHALEQTGDAMLIEGTWWGDRIWGVDLHALGYPGRNWLGTLLMAQRAMNRADVLRVLR
jgi:ribA/ribD-fused uncharacterized protein